MSETAMRTANPSPAVADKSPLIVAASDGATTTMTMIVPGVKQVRQNVLFYPRTWRWIFWHLLYIVVAGIAYLLLTGFFS